jgi:hypothetical protein
MPVAERAVVGVRGGDESLRRVVRLGVAVDVDVAGGVHGDAVGHVLVGAADEGRVDHRPGRAQLRVERVGDALGDAAAEGVVIGVRRDRKIGRERGAGDVGIAGRVHGEAAHVLGVILLRRAAEEGRVDQRGAGRIELGDERIDVDGGARLRRLDRPRRRRIAGGVRGAAGDVDVARRIEGDVGDFFLAGAAKVGRVDQRRIDHQRLRAIVAAHLESHLGGRGDDVAARHFVPRARDRLVGDRLVLAHRFAAFDVQQQIARRLIDLEPRRAVELQPDRLRIAAGRDDEVVFELTLVAVVDQIDAVVDARARHAIEPLRPGLERRRAAAIPADHLQPRGFTAQRGVRPRADHRHPHRRHAPIVLATHRHGGVRVRQRNPISRATGDEADGVVELSAIFLERLRLFAQRLQHLLLDADWRGRIDRRDFG